MLAPWINLALLAAESQQVIGLRLMKFAMGGTDVMTEAGLMVFEKMDATRHASERLMLGETHHVLVTGYRDTVHANVIRLSKR